MTTWPHASIPSIQGPRANDRPNDPIVDNDIDDEIFYDDYEPSWYVPHDGDNNRFVGEDGLPALHLITYTDTAGETILRLCEDSTGLLIGPSDRRLPHAGVYVSQLRGEYYHQDACRAGDFAPGQPVRLVRELHNQFDKNAVAVYDSTGEHGAAYVNKQKARMLSKIIDAGENLQAISIRGTHAGKACGQIAILAAKRRIPTALLWIGLRPGRLGWPATSARRRSGQPAAGDDASA
jgi:HIRAN domain